jgi:hypothetical protein
MADQKITQLTALAAPSSDDLFAIVDDPSGAATTKKVAFSAIKTAVTTIGDTQVAFGDGANTIGGDSGLTWNKTTDSLILTTASSSDQLRFINSTAGPTHFSEIGVDASGSLQLNADNNNVSITISADGTVYGNKWNGSLFEFYTNGVIRTSTTTAHTALFQAYDVNGTAYKTFATLTNGDVPSFTISQPSGGILAFIPPTSDPGVPGAIWNNAGTLAIS